MQMLANEHYDAGITEMIGPCGFAIFSVLYPLPEGIVPHLGPWDSNLWKVDCRSFSDQLQLFTDQDELQLRCCDLLLGDNDTMQMLANEHYDAGITEMIGPCGFAIFSVSDIIFFMAALTYRDNGIDV
ncbi:hypothetical protein COOONC_12604 [Cooperia oncophora]